ncbi:hypothetical protein VST7929_01250 [Vibrio stylophorae]|uniref:Uncharacterized protein n=1 Tax=Vibrio stylophorae TaxID=659351 RepID=A0ABM8ZSU4_9VIBR|nr:hypothetical protein [Vibrio stylophorae]CAH0533384.1 hypothetical protein VST7929_01250 [Vibrio stylophorae]
MRFYQILILVVLQSASFLSYAEIPVDTSMSSSQIVNVNPGDVRAEIPFRVDTIDTVHLEVIVPIDNVRIHVLDPNGDVVISHGQSGIWDIPGEAIEAGLPGAHYFLPELKKPLLGDWLIVVEFPYIDYKTAIMVNVFMTSPVQLSPAIPNDRYILGESVTLAALLTVDGIPMLNQSVVFEMQMPSGQQIKLRGMDNGEGADGTVADGVYSVLYSELTELGEYLIKATTTLTYDNRLLTREFYKRITVNRPQIDVKKVTLFPVLGYRGCLETVRIETEVDVFEAGTYAITQYLIEGERKLRYGNRETLVAGKTVLSVQVEPRELFAVFDRKSRLSIGTPRITQISEKGSPRASARKFYAQILDLSNYEQCRKPVDFNNDLVVEEVMSANGRYISALKYHYTVYIQNPDVYITTFQVKSASTKELVKFVTLKERYVEGENQVSFIVDGRYFQKVDGPYLIDSVGIYPEIYQAGDGRRGPNMGPTKAYKKEQFMP